VLWVGALISIMFKLFWMMIHLTIMAVIFMFWAMLAVICLCTKQRVPRPPRLGLARLL
jgi:hypothetical protein